MSSITDKPISFKSEDLLKVEKYSFALSNFIVNSKTPITIGLQGEWGTGKTSLMSLLLEDFTEKEIATSWVNTWEYSMFRGAHETTPGVLRGMLEKLKESCEKDGWTLKGEAQANFKKAASFLGGLANQVISSQTGVNIKDAAANTSTSAKARAEIAEIKELISSLINDLINDPNNSYKKVVFFVDDLDRIPPADAVEVLESLKNLFDIPHCVFILAIDYEIVVKGLENKFGKKTEENEREFRSFFDKIIQVPFSMPIGTYDIENFLIEQLRTIGVDIDEGSSELYAKTVRLTIGSNPRSLKRYLNSFSLINYVKEADDDSESGEDYMLFALLGIQVSYPKIFRLITQFPDFTNWNRAFANKCNISWEEVQEKLVSFGDNELVDEEWEQVAWGACQKDPYMKSKAFSVLELLNLLREKFNANLEKEILSAMTFASITSVDDDIETKQAIQKVGNKTIYDGVESKLIQLREEQAHEGSVVAWEKIWRTLIGTSEENEKYRVSLAKTGCSFNDDSAKHGKKQLFYSYNPAKRGGIVIQVKYKAQSILDTIKVEFSLSESENISIKMVRGSSSIQIETGFYNEIGAERFTKITSRIIDLILE
jgi:hypothetical protein|tara:strand:+ start:202 stop:1998 length:1797 start_codon:yes stop_codon:yes gene_type:complete